MSTRRRWTFVLLATVPVAVLGSALAGPATQGSITVGPNPRGMAVRGNDLAVALGSGAVAIVDSRSNEVAVHEVGREPVDVALAGRRLYVLHHAEDKGQRGRVTMLDAASGRVLGRADVGRSPVALAVDPGENLVYTANFRSQSVTVLDARDLALVGSVGGAERGIARQGYPTDVEVDSRAHVAFVSTTDGYLNLLRRTRVLDSARVQRVVGDTALEIDERRGDVYMTNAVDGRVTRVRSEEKSFKTASTWMFDDLQAERVAIAPRGPLAAVLGVPVPDEEPVDEVIIVKRRTGEEVGRTQVGFGAWDMQPSTDAWHFYLTDALGDAVLVVAADGEAPRSTLDLPEPAIVDPGERLSGTSSDDWSGVESLTVYFEGPSASWSERAVLDCDRLRSCNWTVDAAPNPGSYSVRLEGRDRAGNLELAEERTVTWVP